MPTKNLSLTDCLRKAKQIAPATFSVNVKKERWYFSHLDSISPTNYYISCIGPDKENVESNIISVSGTSYEDCLNQLENIFRR